MSDNSVPNPPTFFGMLSIAFSTTLPTTGIKPATALTGSIIFLTTFELAILFIPLPANFNNFYQFEFSNTHFVRIKNQDFTFYFVI